MSLEQIAQDHYRRQSLLARSTTDAVLQLWTSLGPAGYEAELTRAAGLMAAGQLAAARQAGDYVTAAALEQGVPAGADVVARAFAGQTADGMPLDQVLRAPLTRAQAMQAAGATADDAARSGAATLTRLVSNEVTQAGTNATAVAMTANPGLNGYVRMLHTPSCGRCAIQAGKWFKWNAGFKRHPRCDCVHVPASEQGTVDGLSTNPRAYFDSLSKADQDHYFGTSEAKAIRGGADMGRTVNATTVKSGMTSGSASAKPTWGVARTLQQTEVMDRDRAIALLRERGYVAQQDVPVRVLPKRSTFDERTAYYADLKAGRIRLPPANPNWADDIPRRQFTLAEALDGANPKNGKRNCVKCVASYELRRRGYNVAAKTSKPSSAEAMLAQTLKGGTGRWQRAPMMTPDYRRLHPEVRQSLDTVAMGEPDGARFFVQWEWYNSRSGHIICAERRNGRTVFIDPQTGKETIGDPTAGSRRIPSNVRWVRVDDADVIEGALHHVDVRRR